MTSIYLTIKVVIDKLKSTLYRARIGSFSDHNRCCTRQNKSQHFTLEIGSFSEM
jgi:hypothetical protein